MLVLVLALSACSSTKKESRQPLIIEVNPGESIQTAVDSAKSGDLVLINPGTYAGSIVIQTKDITLRGKERNSVIIDGKYEKDNGIIAAADGIRIENLTVQKFRTNGVLVQGGYENQNQATQSTKNTSSSESILKRYSVQYVNALNNGLYGIYAFAAQEGVISNTYTYGNADAGIYIGQCKPCNAEVTYNYATFNGLGIQGANASGELYVYGNIFENNRSGIEFLSETKELKPPQEKVVIAKNLVDKNNNQDAPSSKPEIYGYGILIAGGASNSVDGNSVTNNIVGGIVLTAQGDFLPNNNKVINNIVSNNAIDLQYFIAGRPDVMSLGNCFENNIFGSSNIEGIESKLLCKNASPGPFTAAFRAKPSTKNPPLYNEIAIPQIDEKNIEGNIREIPKNIVKILHPDLNDLETPKSR